MILSLILIHLHWIKYYECMNLMNVRILKLIWKQKITWASIRLSFLVRSDCSFAFCFWSSVYFLWDAASSSSKSLSFPELNIQIHKVRIFKKQVWQRFKTGFWKYPMFTLSSSCSILLIKSLFCVDRPQNEKAANPKTNRPTRTKVLDLK